MAKLRAMPSQAIIDQYKGKVDFYLWKGIPCARMWPHWPKRDPTPDEKANQDAFAYAIRAYSLLSNYQRKLYRDMAAGTRAAPRDFFVRSYLNGNPF